MKTNKEIEFEKNIKLREKFNKSKTNLSFEQWKLNQKPMSEKFLPEFLKEFSWEIILLVVIIVLVVLAIRFIPK